MFRTKYKEMEVDLLNKSITDVFIDDIIMMFKYDRSRIRTNNNNRHRFSIDTTLNVELGMLGKANFFNFFVLPTRECTIIIHTLKIDSGLKRANLKWN